MELIFGAIPGIISVVPQPMLENIGLDRAAHGRSQLHDTFATSQPTCSLDPARAGCLALIRGRRPVLVDSPVTLLASKSHLGLYGDGGKLQAQKGTPLCDEPKLLFLLPSQRPVAQVHLVLEKSPHPIALDITSHIDRLH